MGSTLLGGGSGWCLPARTALSLVIQWWLNNPNCSGSSVSKFTWSTMLHLMKRMNKPNLRVIIFVALLLLTGGLRANQLTAKSSPISGLSGLEQISSQDRIVLKSNRQLFNCTFYYQLHKDKVWLHINIFACSCELTFFAHFNWSLLAEHTSFGMGEWVHTFKWRFFFFLLLELSAEGKSFLLLSFTRNTHGRAPEWCRKVGAVQPGKSSGFFPSDGGWQLETQWGWSCY